jgi:flagellum-specific peptidoglycan hydrolase FlgJ
MSLSPAQSDFLDLASDAAQRATCAFPQMVACEAALESTYGMSGLAKKYNNLFGMKTHRHNLYGSVNLPTKEFLDGKWISVGADFETYPDWDTCFFDRLSTLIRLSSAYPHYAAALAALDAETYVREVSKTWSTDPHRAEKVIAIYAEYAK